MTAKQISEFSSVQTDVSVESVARYFGGSGYTPNEKARNRIRRCIDHAFERISPKATYTLFPVSSVIPGKEIVLENGLSLPLPECIVDPGAHLVATVIGSLGERLEKHCRILAKAGEIYESTLFDAVGTVMLDLLSDDMCKIIENVGKQSELFRGLRFAPGIDGYPLEYQHLLFQMADNESVGVFLNESAIMVPTKSVSFFMMLTDTPVKNRAKNKCSVCRLLHCQYRTSPTKG